MVLARSLSLFGCLFTFPPVHLHALCNEMRSGVRMAQVVQSILLQGSFRACKGFGLQTGRTISLSARAAFEKYKL